MDNVVIHFDFWRISRYPNFKKSSEIESLFCNNFILFIISISLDKFIDRKIQGGTWKKTIPFSGAKWLCWKELSDTLHQESEETLCLEILDSNPYVVPNF